MSKTLCARHLVALLLPCGAGSVSSRVLLTRSTQPTGSTSLVVSNTDPDAGMFPAARGRDVDPFPSYYTTNSSEELVVCACAKCGSTTLYNWLYDVTFGGKEWPQLGDGGPQSNIDYVGLSPVTPWQGRLVKKPPAHFKKGTLSLAFVREPVSRLVSAWEDKLSCGLFTTNNRSPTRIASDDGTVRATEEKTRIMHGNQLFALEGRNRSFEQLPGHCLVDGKWVDCLEDNCVSLRGFAEALLHIHKQGKEGQLDIHFRPQTEECFQHHSVSEYSNVTTLHDENAIRVLQRHVHTSEPLSDEHATGSTSGVNVSAEDHELLHEVTRAERQLLGPFL